TGRNYICRMIIRRAARFGTKLGLHEPFLAKVAEAFIQTYRDFYPELEKSHAAILDDLTREEIRFARTVETGTAHLENLLGELRRQRQTSLDGRKVFELYATYGLPFEIARDIAREQSLDVDEAGFRAAMDEHRLASGGGKAMGALGGEDAEFFSSILRDLQAKGKLGDNGVEQDAYTSTHVEGEVLMLIVDGESVQSASFGDPVEVILPKTGFYIESGGQVSDMGIIRSLPSPSRRGAGGAALPAPVPQAQVSLLKGEVGGWEIEITDIRKPSAGVILHIGEVISGQPRVGDKCIVEVDMERRHDIMRNHTATHLLHLALHKVLGEHARQAGSLVAPDRLRFDFNHSEALTPEQIERVEKLVNEAVAADMTVVREIKSREQAIAGGALALFGEKYGEEVSTITIAEGSGAEERHSYELCGGTHLSRTGDIGAFIIVSEGSAAAGIRRIEAVTGRGAYNLIAQRFRALKESAALLSATSESLPERIEGLLGELASARKQINSMRQEMALTTFNVQLANLSTISGVPVLAVNLPNADADTLRQMADRFRQKYP
ncbi:MAG: alanine--tRNA ligase-related protein, partial [Anaerolineales bacterium]|nr:alanine--tRNA ligase-related protein [Anaerolineales bacterium]